MKSDTQTIVQNFLLHLSQRNLESLETLFADEVDWYIPGDEINVSWLGRRNSREEIHQFYQILWQHTEPISADVDHVFLDDENAVITGSFTTKMLPTGKIVDSPFSIQMRIENGKITRYRLLENSYAVSAAMTP